jgi:hypothetical protein
MTESIAFWDRFSLRKVFLILGSLIGFIFLIASLFILREIRTFRNLSSRMDQMEASQRDFLREFEKIKPQQFSKTSEISLTSKVLLPLIRTEIARMGQQEAIQNQFTELRKELQDFQSQVSAQSMKKDHSETIVYPHTVNPNQALWLELQYAIDQGVSFQDRLEKLPLLVRRSHAYLPLLEHGKEPPPSILKLTHRLESIVAHPLSSQKVIQKTVSVWEKIKQFFSDHIRIQNIVDSKKHVCIQKALAALKTHQNLTLALSLLEGISGEDLEIWRQQAQQRLDLLSSWHNFREDSMMISQQILSRS